MQVLSTRRFEETAFILVAGVDYQPSDMEPDRFTNGSLSHLPAERLTEIAQAAGFDKWSWAGHESSYDQLLEYAYCKDMRPEDGSEPRLDESINRGIPVKFRKYLVERCTERL